MSISGNGHHTIYDLPKPQPDFGPQDVTQIIMEALQHNDDPCMDCGIEVAFNFASAANRAVTGPLPRFAEMVRNPMYQALLNFTRVEFDPIMVQADHAEQRIRVYDSEGSSATYIWMLTRQPGPAWKNCWMTDSVIRVE